MDFRSYLMSLPPDVRCDFAKNCGTSVGYFYKALSNGQKFGPVLSVRIERASGRQVTRKDLRPDDWMEIWPELVEDSTSHLKSVVNE